jgi:5-formyltetrahydrofolate cyclo-ligase
MKPVPSSTQDTQAQDISSLKREVRDHFRSVRESLSAEQVAAASTAHCERLSQWPLLREAHTVLTYVAFRNEIDLAPLLETLPGIKWVAPRVVGRRMVLHPYDPSRLVRHRYGMLEPPADAPVVDPQTLDLVLVPGVAYDWRGGRMGFGGGFYDGFLPTTPALRVGITYDACLVDELPSDDHDQRMDWIVTPTQFLHCAPLWRKRVTTTEAQRTRRNARAK